MRAVRAAFAAGLAVLAVTYDARAGDTVPVSRAADHVGKETTIEGRVVATYASPLATVLAFAPNFAGFTASVLAGDRLKFPPDFDQRCRDRVVRVTGIVTTYRGKPEMTLREPSQLLVIPAPGASPVLAEAIVTAPSVVATPDRAREDASRRLADLEERLDALESRLAAIERGLDRAAAAAEERPTLRIGAPARAVRALLGDPLEIRRAPDAGSTWIYEAGRSVAFDRAGRVAGWDGF
jgi:hypothetical protein